MKESTPEERQIAQVYRRFYAALQLRDLCNEMPIYAIARKYDIPRGHVQNLAQTCHGFAAGMIKFCERMNWGALAAVLDHFSDRLKAGMCTRGINSFLLSHYLLAQIALLIKPIAGAKADLLALTKIPYVKSRTARIFWENGFKTVAAVAMADTKDLLPVLLIVCLIQIILSYLSNH